MHSFVHLRDITLSQKSYFLYEIPILVLAKKKSDFFSRVFEFLRQNSLKSSIFIVCAKIQTIGSILWLIKFKPVLIFWIQIQIVPNSRLLQVQSQPLVSEKQSLHTKKYQILCKQSSKKFKHALLAYNRSNQATKNHTSWCAPQNKPYNRWIKLVFHTWFLARFCPHVRT